MSSKPAQSASAGVTEALRGERWWLASLMMIAGVISVLLVAGIPDSIIAGDPAAYRQRVDSMLTGGLPYIDVPFEHLPVMLAPMFAAWWLGGAESQSMYIVVFAGLMTAVMAVVAALMYRLGRLVEAPRLGLRWFLLTLPLIPLVIFRNDPVSVLLAVLALLSLARGGGAWGYWAAAGSLAKLWPAVLAVPGWVVGRWRSTLVVLVGAVGFGWTLLPGFSNAREASGIHAETVVGALLGLFRTLRGESAEVFLTTAAYIPVGSWAIVVNGLVGLTIVGWGLGPAWKGRDIRPRLLAAGTVVVGIILTSQLFSLQYALWLTPFVALSEWRSVRWLGVVLGVGTCLAAFGWTEAMFDHWWAFAGFTVRNLVVLVLGLALATEARRTLSLPSGTLG